MLQLSDDQGLLVFKKCFYGEGYSRLQKYITLFCPTMTSEWFQPGARKYIKYITVLDTKHHSW